MKLLVLTFYFLLCLFFTINCVSSEQEKTLQKLSTQDRLEEISKKMAGYLAVLSPDSLNIPRALEKDGKLIGTNSRQWTSGFFPGTLWQLYGNSKNEKLKIAAETWTAFIGKEQFDTHTHDLGFKINSSFGKGYEISGNQKYKNVIIQASKTLSKRFNSKIGSLRSWDWNADIWQFPVIIDNMMNLEMLFEATEFTGDSSFYQIADQHAKTAMRNHMRPDNSSYHVIDYDTLTGDVRLRITHQGYSDESAWSRGQAWALYGFTTAYAKTKNVKYLEKAEEITKYIFNNPNLPEDLIPYWDFNAPNIPNEVRDVSAACVTASALLDLMNFVPENKELYMSYVDGILNSLSEEKYQSNVPPFILDHSTGSVPGDFEIDVPIIYADYYYVEALIKRLSKEKN